MQQTIYFSRKISEVKEHEIFNYLKKYEIPSEEKYVKNQFLYNDLTIKIYESKKGLTLFINGNKRKIKSLLEKLGIHFLTFINYEDQIGSDEVGTGDFLLPIIVVATMVRKKDIPLIEKYSITDSKSLNDEKIRKIGPIISKKFHFSKLTLTNEKYNEMIKKGYDINILKAKLHNRVLLNLKKEFEDINNVFIDQFVQEKTFFKYLKDEDETINNLTFKTKGETYYPSVALASVIARYSLLLYKDKLSEKYRIDIPLGAGKNVDLIAKKFIKEYGFDEFKKIAKLDFNNMNKLD